MGSGRRAWLITNSASGSNTAEALTAFADCCHASRLCIAQRTAFPAQELPTPAMLDAARIDLVAVFAGDGTINAAIDGLAGWGGAVAVLPGGTMNLLYGRLFGDLSLEEALAAVARGNAKPRRPGIIASPIGNAYAGLLAGPGTSWNEVREAIRASDLVDMASDAREAIAETVAGEMIACIRPELGRKDGYPLLLLAPRDEALMLTAYYADSALEYLDQALALLRRDFREGPHKMLGTGSEFTLAVPGGSGFGALKDGEPVTAKGPTQFTLARCEVDLLATVHDGR